MFGLVRTAVRFFFVGFGIGILLAPRAGAETRELIREKVNLIVGSILEVADVTVEDGGGDKGGTAASRGRARGRTESGAGAKA